MVLVKNGPFFRLFILGNIGQKNEFCDILEGRNTFLGYKKKSSKCRKIEIFPKGLVHGFNQKWAIFPSFHFRQYSPRK